MGLILFTSGSSKQDIPNVAGSTGTSTDPHQRTHSVPDVPGSEHTLEPGTVPGRPGSAPHTGGM